MILLKNTLLLKESFQYEDSNKSYLKYRLPNVNINTIHKKLIFNFKSIIDVSILELPTKISSKKIEKKDISPVNLARVIKLKAKTNGMCKYIHKVSPSSNYFVVQFINKQSCDSNCIRQKIDRI